jgi:hypothetical protein
MKDTHSKPTRPQLELHFHQNPACHAGRRRAGRPGLARWWFAQMRHAVDRATDWHAAPPARPEQTFLELARSH